MHDCHLYALLGCSVLPNTGWGQGGPLLSCLQVIPAIEEAVLGMQAGGIRRVEIRGEHPELSYPRPRNERFAPDGK